MKKYYVNWQTMQVIDFKPKDPFSLWYDEDRIRERLKDNRPIQLNEQTKKRLYLMLNRLYLYKILKEKMGE